MIGILFFTTFLATLATTFILLGFASGYFHFCVWGFSVVASISFEMILIAWSCVSKLGVPSLPPRWRMWSIALTNIIAFTIKSMVVFSSIDVFDHGIISCIVSFGGEMLTWWGFNGIDGVQSCLIPMFISET